MGFFDKLLHSSKKEDIGSKSDGKIAKDEESDRQKSFDNINVKHGDKLLAFIDILKNSGDIRNFEYLDGLIHSGVNEIVLDSDIVLGNLEQLKYSEGIKLDVDNLIIDGNGHAIDAKGKTRIFLSSGKNITFRNIIFKNGDADGAAMVNEGGTIEIDKCEFRLNTAVANGGAILNFGKITLTDSLFDQNATKKDSGGAINNQSAGHMIIDNCEFTKNTSNNGGGAILNWGQLSITKTIFAHNSTEEQDGGAINNQGGDIDINDCEFRENISKRVGGAILNWGNIKIAKTTFVKNATQKHEGGAINNQGGNIDIENCEFIENTSAWNGGAILNNTQLKISNTIFNRNTAIDGGAIKNYPGTILRIIDCDFEYNNADDSSCISNESDNVKVINSTFLHNNGSKNIVFNKNNMEILECRFKSNEDLDCIIYSQKGSKLIMSEGEITDNHIKTSTIHNEAALCSVNSTIFKDNVLLSSSNQFGVDILNEAELSIQSPKITGDEAIINHGHIEVRKLSHSETERIIKNIDGGSVDEFDIPKENSFDFSHLDNLILNNDVVNLDEDIVLESYELDFYEGGIEIDRDNLVIDGNGHVIDARSKIRIFNVTGKNITLKNIIFKNGLSPNSFDEHTTGGGAIKIVKNSDVILENCQFIDNASQDDGGAILNNGVLHSQSNKFINNNSRYYGGAIHNNNLLETVNDSFKENKSKIAGAIYNNGKLGIEESIFLSKNTSDLKQQIYNANITVLHKIPSRQLFILMSSIFDTYKVVKEFNDDWDSFNNLADELGNSNEISLNQDIKIQYGDLTNPVNLDNDMVLDGCNHVIDMSNLNVNFKVNSNVIIKNITFKNADIHKDSLFEINGNIQFENVRFLNNKVTTDNHLFTNNGELKFINSSFYNNTSKNNPLISNSNSLKIDNVDFVNNHANSKGSVCYNNILAKEKTLINNARFRYNSSKAGIIFNGEQSVMEISNSEFIKNTAKNEGGAIVNFSQITLTKTIFDQNCCQEVHGGAINNQTDAHMMIDNCEFRQNTANRAGGAIANWGQISLTESIFSQNKASEMGGGAINNQRGGVVEASNVKFNDNFSYSNGGAIYSVLKSDLKLKDCKFRDNFPNDVN